MELTKKDSKMLQAIFVMAMLCLHLFDRYDFQGLYRPILFIKDIPLTFYIAQLCDCCVMGFAFCSGYGHWKQYESGTYSLPKRIKSLFQLYFKYWIIIVIFSGLSIMKGQGDQIPGSFSQIIQNVTAINPTYNGASWYIFIYAIIIISSELHLRAKQELPTVIVLLASGILYLIAWYVRFEIGTSNTWLLLFGKFGMTMFEYDLGALAAKEYIFTKISVVLKKFPKGFNVITGVCLLTVMLLGHTLIIGNIVVAPITGLVIIVLFKHTHKPELVKNILLFLGGYSTGIWLVHMYFYATVFEKLVYRAQYPILIYFFLLVLSLVTSMVIEFIYQNLENVIEGRRNR